MPQKSNPVLAETLVALAAANGAQAGLAQQALLQTEERDGGNWAIEWLCLPQMLVTTAAGLRHAATLAADLRPDPARMAGTLETNGGTAHAEEMAFLLAGHVGLPEAHAILKAAVQAQARDGGTLAVHVSAACTARNVPPPVLDPAALARGAESLVRRANPATRRHFERPP